MAGATRHVAEPTRIRSWSIYTSEIINKKRRINPSFFICEPTTPQLEPLFASILKTYTRLKELGFIYFNGTVSILEMEEGAHE